MFKNLRRGQTVTVQKRDSNNWTVTVQVFVDDDFDYLRGITGFSLNIELVASCVSLPTTLILLESEFYNSRYG
jgi:hypothetical protein